MQPTVNLSTISAPLTPAPTDTGNGRKPLRLRGRRVTLALVIGSLTGVFIMLGLLVRYQEKMIFPGSIYRGAPFTKFTPSLPDEAVKFTVGGETVFGVWRPAPHPTPETLTVLYFYGNGSCLATTQDDAAVWRSLGVNLMMLDYPGYGMSGGSPSEAGIVEARNAALDFLRDQKHVSPFRLIIAGSSLGGAVAIRAAAEHPPLALITLCTFTSMSDMAARNVKWLPFKDHLLRHPFASQTHLQKVTCPILMIHAENDLTVPFAMRDRLAETARATPVPGGRAVETVTLSGGAHGSILLQPETKTAIRAFLNDLKREEPSRKP